MKELVKRELNWVLDSPAFFGPNSQLQSHLETQNQKEFPLPGMVTYRDEYRYLSTPESSRLVGSSEARGLCSDLIRNEILSLKTGRLGVVFEKYLEEILKFRCGSELVRYRVPVRERAEHGRGWKTWGEYDFLFLNSDNDCVEHWETSIKFYLQVQNDPAWKYCWGPGVVDRLDLKGPKMFLQQLNLSSTELGRSVFPDEWIKKKVVKRVFAKGTIFYLWDPEKESFLSRCRSIVHPTSLAEDHQKSWWIFPDSLPALRDIYPDYFVAILPRRYWMTGLPMLELRNESLENWSDFMDRFSARSCAASERRECLYIALYRPDGFPFFETAGFVVTPHFIQVQGKKISAE